MASGGRQRKCVGTKLRTIAKSHQVLCTTHLPQIASKGDFHLKTEKGETEKATFVEIRELAGNERLAGNSEDAKREITDVSLSMRKNCSKRTNEGMMVIEKEYAKGCGYCVDACPLGVISIEKKFNKRGLPRGVYPKGEMHRLLYVRAQMCPEVRYGIYREG